MQLLDYIPRSELETRWARVRRHMECDALIVLQNVGIYYLTGTTQTGVLWFPREGEPVLAVRKSHERAKVESALKNIVPFKSYSELPSLVPNPGKTLGFELDVVPVSTYEQVVKHFKNFYARRWLACSAKGSRSEDSLRNRLHSTGRAAARPRFSGYPVTAPRRHGGNRPRGANRVCDAERRAPGADTCSALQYGDALWSCRRSETRRPIRTASTVRSVFAGSTRLCPQWAEESSFGAVSPLLSTSSGDVRGYIADGTRVYSLGPLPQELQGCSCVHSRTQCVDRGAAPARRNSRRNLYADSGTCRQESLWLAVHGRRRKPGEVCGAQRGAGTG